MPVKSLSPTSNRYMALALMSEPPDCDPSLGPNRLPGNASMSISQIDTSASSNATTSTTDQNAPPKFMYSTSDIAKRREAVSIAVRLIPLPSWLC
jgi:hypothetical protein